MNEALKQCAQHFDYQLSNERTTVKQLMASIESTNTNVAAALSTIRQDDQGTRNNFDQAVAFLIPNDPHKGLAKKKNPSGLISDVGGKVKEGIGSTGVHFRFYKHNEYGKLSAAQKSELDSWRASPKGIEAQAASKKAWLAGGGKQQSGNAKKKQHKRIKTEIGAVLSACLPLPPPAPTVDAPTPPVPTVSAPTSTVSALSVNDATIKSQSILRRG